MKKSFFFTFFFLFLYSCIDDGMTDTQKDFYKNYSEGLTKKEIQFISKLQNLGYYDIQIISPNYVVESESSSIYDLRFNCPFNITKNNHDSIQRLSDSISHILYSKVMSDGAIFCSNEIVIHFEIDSSYLGKSEFIRNYSKKSLEHKNKFKIIELSEGNFDRIQL